MAKLSQFFATVDQTKYMYLTLYNAHIYKASQLETEDIDLEADDWSGMIFNIGNAVNQLEYMGQLHKFERISKKQMEYIFGQYDSGKPTGKTIIDIPYTVSALDTPRTIEQRFNMPWTTIMDYNEIVPSQLVTGLELKIPVEIELSEIASKEIPTFGDQSGTNILGTDLTNELQEDTDGDLKVLGAEETFAQAVSNLLLTEKGQLPFYEEIGFTPKISDQYNAEERETILQLRVIEALTIDPRVKNVEITDSVKEGIKQTLSLTVQAVNGTIVTTGV